MKLDTHNWIWKWHIIGGLISLPIVFILSLTGAIYLFKDQYEKAEIDELKRVQISNHKLTYENQWEIAKKNWDRSPSAIVIPTIKNEATQFISGKFSHKSSIYIDPFSGNVNGQQQVNQTDMYKVRKLHGELLMGAFGTKIVELIASWMIILIITGIYLFWPRKNWKSIFRIRFKAPKKVLFRDLHAVTGFWFSTLLLLILAGGLPWTDIFGSMFKHVQETTDSGYPTEWNGYMFSSTKNGKMIPLDDMINKAITLDLSGEVHVSLPDSKEAVYSISNETSVLSEMKCFHFDAYSGELLYKGTWKDIGSMMKTRLWVMAFHQGEFGFWNWVLILSTAIALLFLSLFAMLSYFGRKQKNSWNIPKTSTNFYFGNGIFIILIALGILLPMFGISLILISLIHLIRRKVKPCINT
ncbi:MAG: PepSY domain-containing protein [Crocinitomicaceae bacterium]|nr:PepSY domain-containing protein [Crocinitomicaceae bacterium]